MDTRQLIDAQFDRAVEIVQGLPKTGPIQTGYEEKLTMYSLYKQATVGNVKSPRPGIWDMLGRAKWDAWAKHKDLDPYEAKWLYVDALLKVLRKYSDKTVARNLVQELEAYSGDPSNMVMSGSFSKSAASNSSGSTASDDRANASQYQTRPIPVHVQPDSNRPPGAEEEAITSEDETDDEEREHPGALELSQRPQSSLSSRRYRTPMAGSLALSPPPMHASVPAMQPHPGFETPSAFAEASSASAPSSLYPAAGSYAGQYSSASRDVTSPHIYPAHSHYRGQTQPLPGRQFGLPLRPDSRPTLERAVENVQAHLAALNERLESLESLSAQPQRSSASLTTGGNSPRWGRGSPTDRHSDKFEWDWDDLGMWSLVLNPMSRIVASLRQLASFFARGGTRSPTLIIVRRLCLDVSFLLCVLAVARTLWKKSGVRRREVNAALVVLWRAIVGTRRERVLFDRGV